MSSDLYRVKVVEKQGCTVTLRVEVVHPDSNSLTDNVSFALMLLHEGAHGAAKAPLALEVSFADTLDSDWLGHYARGFVEHVEVAVLSGSAEAETEADWLKGTLTITATDPAWVAHLATGAEFTSTAHVVTGDFDDCDPIRPGRLDPNAPVPEGFVAAPGALWKDSGLPTVVRVAAYSASAYRSLKLRQGSFKAAELKDLDGQVVLYQGEYDDAPKVGFLSLAGESIRFFTASGGCLGSSASSSFEGSIGLAELIPGKRRGSRVRVSSLLGSLTPEVRAARVEGEAANFVVAVPPGSQFGSFSAEQLPSLGFHLLLSPLLLPESPPTLLKPSPLSWAVEREVLRRFPEDQRQLTQYDAAGNRSSGGDTLPHESTLMPRLAGGFVAKAEVVSGTAVTAGALDRATEAQQSTALSAPWPEFVVKVTPFHPTFLQHLSAPFSPASLPSWFPDAEPWDGVPPAPAGGPTGFGNKPAGSESPGVEAAPAARASSNTLKVVGIVGGAVGALVLMCLVGAALVGGKGASEEAEASGPPPRAAEPAAIATRLRLESLNGACAKAWCRGAFRYQFTALTCAHAQSCVLGFEVARGRDVFTSQVEVTGFTSLDSDPKKPFASDGSFEQAVGLALKAWERHPVDGKAHSTSVMGPAVARPAVKVARAPQGKAGVVKKK